MIFLNTEGKIIHTEISVTIVNALPFGENTEAEYLFFGPKFIIPG